MSSPATPGHAPFGPPLKPAKKWGSTNPVRMRTSAEQCTRPGYELYRQYAQEFGLELLPYPRRDGEARYLEGKLYTEEMLADRKVLVGLGFKDREAEFLSRHEWHDLPLLFFNPYLDTFADEYQPFGVGLDELDNISVTDLLRREHASDTAIRFVGGKDTSALSFPLGTSAPT